MAGRNTSLADRIQQSNEARGVDRLLVPKEKINSLSDMGTEPQQEPQPNPEPDPQPEKEPEPQPQPDPNPVPQPQSGTDRVTGTDTGTQTGTDTLLQQLMKPSESYIRKVYYPLDYQEEFVRKKAKKYKRTESEIIRIAIDELMKSGKI